jgi:hypothetical protein
VIFREFRGKLSDSKCKTTGTMVIDADAKPLPTRYFKSLEKASLRQDLMQ